LTALAPAQAAAQDGGEFSREDILELLREEPPVSEADMAPSVAILNAAVDSAGDGEVISAGAAHGIGAKRSIFLSVKVLSAIAMLDGDVDAAGLTELFGTPSAVPTEGELAVVRGHLGEFGDVIAALRED
jgi:hypothetical protein